MPTTVIQVFGSLTFETIDSVLKADHVSEESLLSSLTLIKQISLLTNTINPLPPAFLSQRHKRKPSTRNIELGKVHRVRESKNLSISTHFHTVYTDQPLLSGLNEFKVFMRF